MEVKIEKTDKYKKYIYSSPVTIGKVTKISNKEFDIIRNIFRSLTGDLQFVDNDEGVLWIIHRNELEYANDYMRLDHDHNQNDIDQLMDGVLWDEDIDYIVLDEDDL